jgi:tight adherence protein C
MFDWNVNTVILLITLTYIITFFSLRFTETNDDRAYKRLKGLIEITKVKEKKSKVDGSLLERVMEMFEKRFIGFVESQIKKGRLSNLELKIKQAGMVDVSNSQFWTRALIYGLIMSFFGLLTGKPIIALALFGLGAYYPFYKLKGKIEQRQFILLNELPDFLDLVSVSFPALNNIEETFELVASKTDSEVSKEFKIAVNEIKIGRRKRDVFHDLSNRTGVKSIALLVSQINQAEAFGTGLEEILIAQAKTIRHSKKVMAEKRGNTASNLIYLPAMLMLGVSMGVILFPFALQFIQNIGAFQ